MPLPACTNRADFYYKPRPCVGAFCILEYRMYDLRLGDCLEVMRSMPDGSVDSIVTDPPYGMSFQSQWVPSERRKAKIAGDGKPFIWWLAEAHRVLRDGGEIGRASGGERVGQYG